MIADDYDDELRADAQQLEEGQQSKRTMRRQQLPLPLLMQALIQMHPKCKNVKY
jgi:hypothetical protein